MLIGFTIFPISFISIELMFVKIEFNAEFNLFIFSFSSAICELKELKSLDEDFNSAIFESNSEASDVRFAKSKLLALILVLTFDTSELIGFNPDIWEFTSAILLSVEDNVVSTEGIFGDSAAIFTFASFNTFTIWVVKSVLNSSDLRDIFEEIVFVIK